MLDPFAGTGLVHQLGGFTVGVELEPEWASMSVNTIVGNALALPFPDASFTAVVTSPCYGNRLADHHVARDGSARHSYTHDLGRPLHAANAGAMQWGLEYCLFHQAAWEEVHRVLVPGGGFVLSIGDHVRKGARQRVSSWHRRTITKLGFAREFTVTVPLPGLRFGANRDARIGHEYVYLFRKAA